MITVAPLRPSDLRELAPHLQPEQRTVAAHLTEDYGEQLLVAGPAWTLRDERGQPLLICGVTSARLSRAMLAEAGRPWWLRWLV